MSKESKGIRRVSFANWLITLFVSILPGVNLIFFIFSIMLARNPSKRTFATAALVLTLILLIAGCVAVIFFGAEIADWAEELLKSLPEATSSPSNAL